ncbi:choice-of-anchor Q domain-containing protein [Pseudomonas indica]|uniref:choice-of-anchor Q domain-containing protein n=1 Tax=Pseudomonas indica TaxID=137658 RepID=UPI0023F8E444|nr:choice-of-anchor Q domain-containing protein [Pseudomonas indica]MBU3059447.1 CSLREA domain-containing protein [Pseudomonas indica]
MHVTQLPSRLALPCALAGVTLLPLGAHALDLTVTTTSDQFDGLCDAHCSLRDAVQTINLTVGSHRILLPAGTYTLTLPPAQDENGASVDDDDNLNGDLDLRGRVSLVGRGAGTTFIDAARLDRVFEVMTGAALELDRVTLRNGLSSQGGGAIENHGVTTVRRSRVETSHSQSEGQASPGGGIANFGHLNLYTSTITGNGVSGASNAHGAGLYNAGTLFMRDSTLSENRGVDDSQIAMGGGLYNTGYADIARSSFIRNSITGSGGAITNTHVITLSNSTLSGNSSLGTYAAISNGAIAGTQGPWPEATLVHVTLADNTGGGLFNRGRILLRNSLIAGNRDAEGRMNNCQAEVTDYPLYRYRGLMVGIDEGNDEGTCPFDLFFEDVLTFTRLLHPLADNNGVTQTHGLRRGSPAVDAVLPGTCSVSHDQRGLTRPRDGNNDGGARCDVGAFERAAY